MAATALGTEGTRQQIPDEMDEFHPPSLLVQTLPKYNHEDIANY
jgi:hypothetical protein